MGRRAVARLSLDVVRRLVLNLARRRGGEDLALLALLHEALAWLLPLFVVSAQSDLRALAVLSKATRSFSRSVMQRRVRRPGTHLEEEAVQLAARLVLDLHRLPWRARGAKGCGCSFDHGG